jgi:HPt (histidine-containing phosphotransfer) domain-containing protein
MELNQQLGELDQLITALDWTRAAEKLHRLCGAAALAGFTALAGKCRALLRQLSRPQDIALLSQTYLEFLHQARELSEHHPIEAGPGFRHHE